MCMVSRLWAATHLVRRGGRRGASFTHRCSTEALLHLPAPCCSTLPWGTTLSGTAPSTPADPRHMGKRSYACLMHVPAQELSKGCSGLCLQAHRSLIDKCAAGPTAVWPCGVNTPQPHLADALTAAAAAWKSPSSTCATFLSSRASQVVGAVLRRDRAVSAADTRSCVTAVAMCAAAACCSRPGYTLRKMTDSVRQRVRHTCVFPHSACTDHQLGWQSMLSALSKGPFMHEVQTTASLLMLKRQSFC